jgi:hypothetical protein
VCRLLRRVTDEWQCGYLCLFNDSLDTFRITNLPPAYSFPCSPANYLLAVLLTRVVPHLFPFRFTEPVQALVRYGDGPFPAIAIFSSHEKSQSASAYRWICFFTQSCCFFSCCLLLRRLCDQASQSRNYVISLAQAFIVAAVSWLRLSFCGTTSGLRRNRQLVTAYFLSIGVLSVGCTALQRWRPRARSRQVRDCVRAMRLARVAPHSGVGCSREFHRNACDVTKYSTEFTFGG